MRQGPKGRGRPRRADRAPGALRVRLAPRASAMPRARPAPGMPVALRVRPAPGSRMALQRAAGGPGRAPMASAMPRVRRAPGVPRDCPVPLLAALRAEMPQEVRRPEAVRPAMPPIAGRTPRRPHGSKGWELGLRGMTRKRSHRRALRPPRTKGDRRLTEPRPTGRPSRAPRLSRRSSPSRAPVRRPPLSQQVVRGELRRASPTFCAPTGVGAVPLFTRTKGQHGCKLRTVA